MREEWKDIEGYEGLYQVSNTGKVKSLERTVWNSRGFYRTVQERILKPYDNGKDYLRVELFKEGKGKTYLVHQLVSQAFIPNPNNLPIINHKNEIKSDNRVSNLEWCDYSYNNTYNGKAKKAGKKVAEKRKKPVISVDKESGLIMFWESTKEASMQLNISTGGICDCLKGRQKSAGGFYWHYASDSEEVANEK